MAEHQNDTPAINRGPELDRDDPIKIAREIVHKHFWMQGLKKLHFYRGELFLYLNGSYRKVDNADIRATIWTFLEKARNAGDYSGGAFKPTRHIVNNVFDAL